MWDQKIFILGKYRGKIIILSIRNLLGRKLATVVGKLQFLDPHPAIF